MRHCSGGDAALPELAINFDLFAAVSADVRALFPSGLPPLTTPRVHRIAELKNPFDGTVQRFEPSLSVESFEPLGPWPDEGASADTTTIVEQLLPWIECEGLGPEAFESLGDALGVPLPAPNDAERAQGLTPDRLEVALYLPPESASIVLIFPLDFRKALAEVKDTKALGLAWAQAFRARRIKNLPDYRGVEPDPQRLSPFFSAVAADAAELAREAIKTGRNLYVFIWPD